MQKKNYEAILPMGRTTRFFMIRTLDKGKQAQNLTQELIQMLLP